MAATTKLTKPKVFVTGRKIISGVVDRKRREYKLGHNTKVQGNIVRNTNLNPDHILTFKSKGDDVTVRIDCGYPQILYEDIATNPTDFQGRYNPINSDVMARVGDIEVNRTAEVYYTLNGKDPIRTKSNLYTEPFTLHRDTAGDKTIIKVKTYYDGKESEMETVYIKLDSMK